MTNAKRYGVLYGVVLAWILMITFVPSVSSRSPQVAGGAEAGLQADPLAPVAQTLDESGLETPTAEPSQVGATRGPRGTRTPVGSVAVGSGVTRGGVPCAPGVAQLPNSQYSRQCVAHFNGDNGGATHSGVTKDRIRLAVRGVVEAGGGYEEYMKKYEPLLKYFQKSFELYGRRVDFEFFQGQGSSYAEITGKGEERACLDAAAIKQAGYFGVLAEFSEGSITNETSAVFAKCAAREGLVVLNGPNWEPADFYKQLHPYIWAYMMDCDKVADHVATYVGRRLGKNNARLAGDPAYRSSPRRYGLYIPSNDGYQYCGDRLENTLKSKYGIELVARENYVLEIPLLPHQAANAAATFKDAGVTTLLMLCDIYSIAAMTHAAQSNEWGPEWIQSAVAGQDIVANARLYDQEVTHHHMFGMGMYGPNQKWFARDEEPTMMWRNAGVEDPTEVQVDRTLFWINVFNMMQSAGPVLTPTNFAAGLQNMPATGSADGVYGTWSFAGDHSRVEDLAEVGWDAHLPDWDGGRGTFVHSYNGSRFEAAEWPAEEPPLFR